LNAGLTLKAVIFIFAENKIGAEKEYAGKSTVFG